MKKCIKICSLFLVFAIILTNLSVAASVSEYTGETKGSSDEVIENIQEGVDKATTQVNSLAYTIIEQISDKSLPVCALLMLWGAVLYFILGIRNLYKKRQGMLLMWGAFTFVVIAKIVNFVFWFAFIRA